MSFWLPLLLLLAEQPAREIQIEVSPPRPIQGGLVVVEVRGGEPGDKVSGLFGERKLRFFVDAKGRVRALAGVGVSQEGSVSLMVKVTPPDGDPVIHGKPLALEAGVFEKESLSVNRKFIKPPRKLLPRIRKEGRQIRKLWKAKPTARKWQGDFVWPRKDRICSSYGLKRMFNNKLKSRHYGVDIDGKMGDPVRAIAAGTVVMVSDRYYSGGTVVIDHGLRLFSSYFHLSGFAVQSGDRVSKGQPIGKVGRSGRVTGPHLHLGVKVEDQAIDPLSLLGYHFEEDEEEAKKEPKVEAKDP